MAQAKPAAMIAETMPATAPQPDQQQGTVQPLRPSLAYVLSDAVTRAGERSNGRHGADDLAANDRDPSDLEADAPAAAANPSVEPAMPPSAREGCATPLPPAAAPREDGGVSVRTDARSRVVYRAGLLVCMTLLASSLVMNVSLLRRAPGPAVTEHQPSPVTAIASSSAGRAHAAAAPAPAAPPKPAAAPAKPQPSVTVASAPARVPDRAVFSGVADKHEPPPAVTAARDVAPAPLQTPDVKPIKGSPPAASGRAAVASLPPSAPVAPSPAPPTLSASEAKALVARGDALFADGDVTSARLFYRRAADGGDGGAALRLGESFDPAFLQQAGLSRIGGDLHQAWYWYRRAHDLGNGNADPLLPKR